MERIVRIALAAALLSALLLCPSCGGQKSPETPGTETDGTESLTLGDLDGAALVRSDMGTAEDTARSAALKKRFAEEAGAEVRLATDWGDSGAEREILVGRTERAEYGRLTAALARPAESCAYGVFGGKLIFYGADTELLERSFDKFFLDCAEGGAPLPAEGEVREFLYERKTIITEDGSVSALKKSVLWGVNGHNRGHAPYTEKNTEEVLRLAAEMGSGIYRVNFNPVNEEQLAYITKVADICHGYGMKVMLVMDNMSGTTDEIAARMTYIAEHLADRIDYFQIFNETDIWCSKTDSGAFYNITNWTGMTEEYYNPERVKIAVEKMTAAIGAFRKAAPEAKIVVNIGSRHFPMLDWYVKAGLSWDVIGFDIYDLTVWDHAEFFRSMEERYPGYDFMVTECNYPANSGPFTEDQQAAWVTSFLKIMNGYDSGRMLAVILYELMDEPEHLRGDTWSGEAHFGLVNTVSGDPAEPKKAYLAAQTLIRGGSVTFEAEFTPVKPE